MVNYDRDIRRDDKGGERMKKAEIFSKDDKKNIHAVCSFLGYYENYYGINRRYKSHPYWRLQE